MIPRAKAGSPILQPQNVVSAEEGFNAMAEGLQRLSTSTSQGASTLASFESNAMLYGEVTELGQAFAQGDKAIQMAKSPDEIKAAVGQYTTNVNGLIDKSAVNQQDRSRLRDIAAYQTNYIERESVNREVAMGKESLRNDLMGGVNTDLKRYTDLLLQDPKAAEAYYQTREKTFTDALSSGLITIDQYNRLNDAYDFAHTKALDVMQMSAEGRATSSDYNAGTTLSGRSPSTRPSNEGVGAFQKDYTTRTDYKGFVSDMVNGRLDVATFMSFGDHEAAMAKEAYTGYQRAVGLTQSNIPMPLIEERLAKLNNAPSGLLTESERVERETLMLAKNELNNDFMGYMLKTAKGAQIGDEFQTKAAGVMNSTLPEDQKQQQYKTLYNQSLNSVVGLAKSQGIPASQIRPASVKDQLAITNGFKLGGNPDDVIATVAQYDKDNAPWLANSIKNPKQAEIVQALGYDLNDPSLSVGVVGKNMVAANQEGVTFSGLVQSKQEGTDNNSLKSSAILAAQPVLNYLNKFPGGANRSGAIVDSIANYAKYRALQNNDTELKHADEYIAEGAALYADAYKVVQGSNYIFNQNDIDLAQTDIKNIVYMVGRDLASSDIYRDRQYTVTYSGGNIIALDPFGSVLWSEPYDRHLVSAASHVFNEQAQKAQQIANNPEYNLMAPLMGK